MDKKVVDALVEVAAEKTFYEFYDGPTGPRKLENCRLDCESDFTLACAEFNIPIVAEFGREQDPEIPNELQRQILGKEYFTGFTVQYQGRECLVTALALGPKEGQTEFSSLSTFMVKPGKIINPEAAIIKLVLVDATISLDGHAVK